MSKTIHVHLPALLRKPVKAKDAESSVQYKGWTIKQNPASLKWYAKTAKNGSGAGAMSDLVKGFKSVEEAKKAIDAVEDDSTKDADPQTGWIENWSGKLQEGKTYLINGRKGKVIRLEKGGIGGRTPLARVQWLEDKKAKDAREQKFGLPVYTEEEIKQKIRNGEWEAETDVAKGKRVELRKGSKRFQVYVKDSKVKDGLSDIERLPDGRLNGRAAAQQGYYTVSKRFGLPKVGQYYDFYDRSGNKVYGKCVASSGGNVTFEVGGKKISLKPVDDMAGR